MKYFQYLIILFIVSLFVVGSNAEPPHQNIDPGQLFPTRLQVTILNDLGNPQDSVEVILYDSEENYKHDTNAVAKVKYTDEDGEVKFTDLKPIPYWIDASKDGLTNYGAGVRTDTLDKGRKNKVNIIID